MGDGAGAVSEEGLDSNVIFLSPNFSDPTIAPKAQKVAKKIIGDPSMVIDGTERFVTAAESYPTLTMVPTP